MSSAFWTRIRAAALPAAAALSFAGCFDEPVPAGETVPPEARVYLNDRGLADLSSCAGLFAAGAAIDYVNLDRNAISEFPRELESLSGLKWLRLNGNRLSSIPDLPALTRLRRIYLRDNALASVPEALKNMPSLTDVDLSGNPIEEIPAWFVEKKGLVAVSLNATRIRRLPENLEGWKSLRQLQLGDLNLSFEEMTRIRKALPDTLVVF